MKPTSAFFLGAGRNQNDAIRPAGNKIVRIVNAVRISEAVAFSDPIAFPAGAQKRIKAPELTFAEKQLEQPRDPPALPKAIAVRNEDSFSGHAKHFFDDSVRVRGVVQGGTLANDVEAGVGKWKRLSRRADQRNVRCGTILNSLLDKGADRFDAANKQMGQGALQVAHAASRSGANVEDGTCTQPTQECVQEFG